MPGKPTANAIRKVLAKMYVNNGITVAQAQEILAPVDAEADWVLVSLQQMGFTMNSFDDRARWEFTHSGLVHYFAMFHREVEQEFGKDFTEDDLLRVVERESHAVLA